MKPVLLFALLLIPVHAFAQAATWEEQLVNEVNLYREAANAAELASTGTIAKYREPLRYNQTLADSGKWWAQALKGTGLMAHGWYTNSAGYLVSEPGGSQISRVWLPSDSGWTDFNIRNAYLGLPSSFQSENGYFGKSTDPALVVYAWSTSPGHYANMINADFTEAGAAQNAWGVGKKSVWLEFMEGPP